MRNCDRCGCELPKDWGLSTCPECVTKPREFPAYTVVDYGTDIYGVVNPLGFEYKASLNPLMCDCPDFTTRKTEKRYGCKHTKMLKETLAREGIIEEQAALKPADEPEETREERCERISAMIGQDF